MDKSKYEIQKLIGRLRDNDGATRITMRHEREEAADTIAALLEALNYAESVCDKAMACMSRWQSGKNFDPSGPEATIQNELYGVIRPVSESGEAT